MWLMWFGNCDHILQFLPKIILGGRSNHKEGNGSAATSVDDPAHDVNPVSVEKVTVSWGACT